MEIDNVGLVESNRADLGQYQINCAMSLAKKYHRSPGDIAKDIMSKFDDRFENVNTAGPGFINISFKQEILLKNANSIKDIGSMDKIVKDYKLRLENAHSHISELEDIIKKYQDSIEELNNSIKNKDIELVNYADSLRAISNSLSWKITKPLRSVSEKLKGITKGK